MGPETTLGFVAGALISVGAWLTVAWRRGNAAIAIAWVAALIVGFGFAYPGLSQAAGRWVLSLDPETINASQIHAINLCLMAVIWLPFALFAMALRSLRHVPSRGLMVGLGGAIGVSVLPGVVGLDLRAGGGNGAGALGIFTLLSLLLGACAGASRSTGVPCNV